jgi:hypothetical protein
MWWIPLVVSAIAGGANALTGMRSQSRENQAQADAENRQRYEQYAQQQRRAARLEDVAGMFRDFGAEQVGAPRGMAQMEQTAQALMGLGAQSSRGMLERSAGETLRRQSGVLDAALASRGIFNSGAGMGQQRQLAGDVMMGLSRDIAGDRQAGMQQLMQAQQAAGGLFGQVGGLDQQRQAMNLQRAMAALQGQAGIYSDEAFGFEGLDPSMFDAEALTPSAWDWFLGALGGAGGGAASAWAANPEMFQRGGTTASRPAESMRGASKGR